MRVYKMYHTDLGSGPIAINTNQVIDEIICDMEENREGSECGYTRENFPKLKESLESLPLVGDINDATIIANFGPFMIKAMEMTEEEYGNLPEFDGY